MSNYAIIALGGKQYRVREGEKLLVDRVSTDEGKTFHPDVLFTGGDGKVPQVDARKLLPLEEGQMVVVSGRAEVNAIGQLVVHARGLYLRR